MINPANPYESPQQSGGRTARHAYSVKRGLMHGLGLGVLGYVIPLVLLLCVSMIRNQKVASFREIYTGFIEGHNSLYGNYFPSIACAFLFALSGIVTYTPAINPGLLRTMIKLGAAVVGGSVLSGLVSSINEPPRPLGSEPAAHYILFRLGIAAILPTIVAAILIQIAIKKSSTVRDQSPSQEQGSEPDNA